MQEAADKADTLIRATFSSVKPSLEWTHDEFDSGMCKDAPELGDVIRRAVVMTEVSEERRGALLGYIERVWKKAGHTITKVNPDKEFPAIYAAASDGVLKMSLTVGYKGQFFLDVQTACVKKSTVAPPNAVVNGTDYYGKKIPEPNVRSDFWSSTELIRTGPQGGN
ncbi:hypothetical protein ABT282_15400 [Streptomyces sp. NPDC000927]|uniref:hypothetical protein n=1 Tax=unclassified Streptomyces TaxID=2593676 RepID=UPI00332D4460